VRFSLFTLVLLTLWIAMGMLVWQRRAPWVPEAKEYSAGEFRTAYPSAPEFFDLKSAASPDDSRWLDVMSGAILQRSIRSDCLEITLFNLSGYAQPGRDFIGAGFLNDDTCIVANVRRSISYVDAPEPLRIIVFHRRHPEWWWGHFYRPEVWALIALTVFSATLAVRSRLKRRTRSA
jgi:hypothetical protein